MADVQNEVECDSFNCQTCITLTGKINRYMVDNDRLNTDLTNLIEANKVLKENEKVYVINQKTIMEEKKELKAMIFNKQDAIDSYLKLISHLKRELAETQSDNVDLKRRLANISTSTMVFSDILQNQRTDTKNKAGIGYHNQPPPSNLNQPILSQEEIKDFVPSVLKKDTNPVAEPVSVEIPNQPETVKGNDVKQPKLVKAADNKQPELLKVLSSNKKKAELIKPKIEPIKFVLSTNVEEVVEVEDVTHEVTQNVKKNNLKPEKKQVIQEKFKNNKVSIKNPSPKITSTVNTFTPSCSHKCSCAVNVPEIKPRRVPLSPKPLSSSDQTFRERRSCFYCQKQGHLINQCPVLARKWASRYSTGYNKRRNFQKSKQPGLSRHVPISKVNNITPTKSIDRKVNVINKQPTLSQKVWIKKSTKNVMSSEVITSIKDNDVLKNKVLTDVIIIDEVSGVPKSVKAWVSISN
jgi:hypothetical protein